ncbi:DNA repair protein RecN [Ornithinimicrobium avium]|uniref:DNA repair protein RecN n=1 Tax=Ornithinimicrobium avium TaxID=2283195 RepID=A0A345NS19_9MICO|nr:DNA repair protein RecN [Ornithinimicrobium avium]AXH97827.1 DNA repair protein RecN [Ornithinimicrobium avium]
MTLRRIRIQGLGVIEDAELELAEGLNVISGETGAGKTMVVSGLGLLLGARADAGLVRSGSPRAVVEGEVDVPAGHPAAVRVEEAGGDTSDGLLLVRTVAAEGRSRAHVGGRSAPVAVLTEVGEQLVAVHGQADQWRLRDAEQHRVLLDDAGGAQIDAALTAYRQVFDSWAAARRRLAELVRTSTERSMRVSMLRAAVEEIAAVDAQEGEEDALRAESERLTHAEELRSGSLLVHDALVGGDDPADDRPSVTGLLASAGSVLAPAAEHDEDLAALRTRLEEIAYLSSDLAADLAAYGTGVEVDEERLAEVHGRRARLGTLLRKYGGTTSAMLELARTFAGELAEIDVSEDDLAALAEEAETLRAQVGRAGEALTAARRDTAARVGREVTEELAHLAMGTAEVTVHVEPRWAGDAGQEVDGRSVGAAGSGPDQPASTVPVGEGRSAHARRHGLDEIEIRLAANPGAPARSVTRAASGGELSRVMLALELVCGGTVPTYVFDEVDAGVGGTAALDLGARLARLGRTAQVVVVTHLGQVAAYADRHLVVRKSTDGQVTSSGVVLVDGQEREAEVARMLGGVADSGAAIEHARELLARRATMA